MSEANAPFTLAYLPLLIQLECRERARLPAYLGSTLHGVVGWALSSNSKVYSYLFENRKFGGAKQDIVNPYIIEPPAYKSVYLEGELLTFNLILLGDAVHYAEAVVKTLASTNRFGLGASKKAFSLSSVRHGTKYTSIWEAGHLYANLFHADQLSEISFGDYSWCSLQLLTPLRIRRGGELLLTIDFATIIRSITRRIEMLTERYGGYVDTECIASIIDQSASIISRSADMHIAQINRYSNRRAEKMDMSGLLGVMSYEGELKEFTPWLQAAQKLHIGRNTTFGYGQVQIVYG